jgi:hypothetical protein
MAKEFQHALQSEAGIITHSMIHQPDIKLDLVFERIVEVSRDLVGRHGPRRNYSNAERII